MNNNLIRFVIHSAPRWKSSATSALFGSALMVVVARCAVCGCFGRSWFGYYTVRYSISFASPVGVQWSVDKTGTAEQKISEPSLFRMEKPPSMTTQQINPEYGMYLSVSSVSELV